MKVLRIFTTGLALCVTVGCGVSGSDPKPATGSPTVSNPELQKPPPPRQASPPAVARDEPDRIHITGTKVSILKPAGFVKAARFQGLHHERWDSMSIMVTEMPAPIKETTAGFTEEKLKTQGMTLVKKEEITHEKLPAVLLLVKQQHRGLDFQKWILVIGNEKQTVLVTGTFMEAAADRFSATLRGAVLSARWEKEQAGGEEAGLGFTLTPPASLKQAGRIGNMLVYTKDGVMPTKSAAEAIVVAGYAYADVVITDKKQFAERRLPQTEQIKSVEIDGSKGMKIGELDAWEIIATAKDKKSDIPMFVYQVIVFDDNTYFILLGLVGLEQHEKLLPDFRTMAKSFRKK